MPTGSLQPSNWLAKRLSLSISTIERLRAADSPDLPPTIVIGSSIRYDEASVEQWLSDLIKSQAARSAARRAGGQDDLAA
jgi:predicted DNA-binding transcriptional regulator AlpA